MTSVCGREQGGDSSSIPLHSKSYFMHLVQALKTMLLQSPIVVFAVYKLLLLSIIP